MENVSTDIVALWDTVRPDGVYPPHPRHSPVQQATVFHRYPAHFRWLTQNVLERSMDRTPRVVCLGGSVGAEAYSLAGCFAKAGAFKRFPDLKIETIDIDPVATAIARQARYPLDGQHGLFMRIKDDVRTHVMVHDAGNQYALPDRGPIDVLLCNNVLGHLPRPDGIDLAQWIYASKPSVLMTGGRMTRGCNVHTPFNLHASLSLHDFGHERADLYRISDWAAQVSFDAAAYRCIRDEASFARLSL